MILPQPVASSPATMHFQRFLSSCLQSQVFSLLDGTAYPNAFTTQDNDDDNKEDVSMNHSPSVPSFQVLKSYVQQLSQPRHFPHKRRCYALTTEAELQLCDGYIVQRTYHYLLALCCGIPIVHLSYLKDFMGRFKVDRVGKKKKRKRKSGGQEDEKIYLSPLPSELKEQQRQQKNDVPNQYTSIAKRRKSRVAATSISTDHNNNKAAIPPLPTTKSYEIIGDTSSTWMCRAPQKARQAILNTSSTTSLGDTEFFQGNGLFQKYTVLLCGQFDTLPYSFCDADTSNCSSSTTGRQKRRSQQPPPSNNLANNEQYPNSCSIDTTSIYSLERIQTLLSLCGCFTQVTLSSKDVSLFKNNSKDDFGCTKNNKLELLQSVVFDYLRHRSKDDDNEEEGNKVVMLIRPNPKRYDWKIAEKIRNLIVQHVHHPGVNEDSKKSHGEGDTAVKGNRVDPSLLPIVQAEWLLDSIGDFEVKNIASYKIKEKDMCVTSYKGDDGNICHIQKIKKEK